MVKKILLFYFFVLFTPSLNGHRCHVSSHIIQLKLCVNLATPPKKQQSFIAFLLVKLTPFKNKPALLCMYRLLFISFISQLWVLLNEICINVQEEPTK